MSNAPAPFRPLSPGDPCPWVKQAHGENALVGIDKFAGRYLVLCFFGSTADPRGRTAMEAVARHRSAFDLDRACFFGVSIDPSDREQRRIAENPPQTYVLWDFDLSASRACGAAPDEPPGGPVRFRPQWIIVDPSLHVLKVFPLTAEPADHDAVFAYLRGLPHPYRFTDFERPAPVLVLPNLFDEAMRRRLIGLYDAHGGDESGVYRQGTHVIDAAFKRRKDHTLADGPLKTEIQSIFQRRVLPEIEKLFFMKITRMERYIVGCYAAEDGGHFRPHRDNGPGATAHRRFAVSINLNGDFDGGEVSFPEYNPRGLKAPPGWAVVFPAAILHAVSEVTYGRRYAFLPFVYDDAGAKIREEHLRSTGVLRAAAE